MRTGFFYIRGKILLSCCLLSVAWSLVHAEVHEYTFENGLKLLVKEDRRAPVVVSQTWYKIGSSYEHDGITGISHVLEHMMFKGTEKYPGGEFSRIISENGGRENAFTGKDYTAFLDFFSIVIMILADHCVKKDIPEQINEFNKILKFVIEELPNISLVKDLLPDKSTLRNTNIVNLHSAHWYAARPN